MNRTSLSRETNERRVRRDTKSNPSEEARCARCSWITYLRVSSVSADFARKMRGRFFFGESGLPLLPWTDDSALNIRSIELRVDFTARSNATPGGNKIAEKKRSSKLISHSRYRYLIAHVAASPRGRTTRYRRCKVELFYYTNGTRNARGSRL